MDTEIKWEKREMREEKGEERERKRRREFLSEKL